MRRRLGQLALHGAAGAAVGLGALLAVPTPTLCSPRRAALRAAAHCEESGNAIALTLTPAELKTILWRFTFKREVENGLGALLGASLIAADMLMLTMTGIVGASLAVAGFAGYVWWHLEVVDLPLLLPLDRRADGLRGWLGGGPSSARVRFMDVAPEMVTLMGLLEAHNVAATLRIVAPSDERSQRVRQIGALIAHSAEIDLPAGQRWEFHVFEDDAAANAFVLPGGKAFVSTALLAKLRRPEELAAVLGHEVAHVQAQHVAERFSASRFPSALKWGFAFLALFGVVTPESIVGIGGSLFKADAALRLLFTLPYSRLHEHEADAVGMDNLVRACIDPAVAPAVWRKMGEGEGRGEGTLLHELTSTHPPAEERARALHAILPSRTELYDERCPPSRRALRRLGLSAR